jgi:hypothetical protein
MPAFSGWVGGGRKWTPEEVALLETLSDVEVAERTGRTVKVQWNRWAVKRVK